MLYGFAEFPFKTKGTGSQLPGACAGACAVFGFDRRADARTGCFQRHSTREFRSLLEALSAGKPVALWYSLMSGVACCFSAGFGRTRVSWTPDLLVLSLFEAC